MFVNEVYDPEHTLVLKAGDPYSNRRLLRCRKIRKNMLRWFDTSSFGS